MLFFKSLNGQQTCMQIEWKRGNYLYHVYICICKHHHRIGNLYSLTSFHSPIYRYRRLVQLSYPAGETTPGFPFPAGTIHLHVIQKSISNSFEGGESLIRYVKEPPTTYSNPSIRKNRRKQSPICTTCFISPNENELTLCANQSRNTQNKKKNKIFFFCHGCHLHPLFAWVWDKNHSELAQRHVGLL